MTIPGLALFYAGMVRKKNVLATMAQRACTASAG
jgi:ammonium transporter, Amt family